MKKTLSALAIVMVSCFAAAQTPDDYINDLTSATAVDPGPPGRRHLRCVATDNGWEEHRGGHRSCRECLALHGNCTERCSETDVQCTADGFNRFGQRQIVRAVGMDQRDALRQVQMQCRRFNLRDCRVSYCRDISRIVSERSCR